MILTGLFMALELGEAELAVADLTMVEPSDIGNPHAGIDEEINQILTRLRLRPPRCMAVAPAAGS